MECGICLKSWDYEDCIPKSIPCGHSFCSRCLDDIFKRKKTGIQCPVCLLFHEMTLTQVQAMPKNFAILGLLSNKTLTGGPVTVSKGTLRGSKNGRCFTEDYIDKLVALHSSCDKHKLPLHSYSPDTKQLLCDKCIIELPNSITLKPILKVIINNI